MRVYIHERRLAVDGATRDRVDRRLGFALGRFAGRVGRVDVHLSSPNGPWGGGCLRCRVVVEVLGHGPVVVEGDDHDLVALIDRTADRVGQTVRRRLDFARLHTAALDPLGSAARK